MLNSNLMLVPLYLMFYYLIEVPAVEFACNLHANTQAQKNHWPCFTASGHKLITYFVISLSMR